MPFKDPNARRAYMKRWNAANREKVKAYTDKWQATHPEQWAVIKTLDEIKQNARRRGNG